MTSAGQRKTWLQGWHVTLICLTLAAAVLAPYASQLRDGFEATMARLGISAEKPNVNPAPLRDYNIRGWETTKAGQFVAVVVGVLAVFAVTYGAAKLLAGRGSCGDTGSELPVAHEAEDPTEGEDQ